MLLSAFSKDVKSLYEEKDEGGNGHNKTHLLEKLSLEVRSRESFDYASNEVHEGQNALLDLWKYMLGQLEETRRQSRLAMLLTLKSIVLRDEFDLGLLRKRGENGNQPSTGPAPVSEKDQEIFIRYKTHLLRSMGLCVSIFLSDTLSKGELMFCLELLAIAFFRVPTICGFLLDSADVQKAKPAEGKDSTSNEKLHAHSLTPAVMETFKHFQNEEKDSDRQHQAFFDDNPSLFEWTIWSQGGDDKSITASLTDVKLKLSQPENFFRFVSFIICHVCKVAVGEIRFGLVPGYWTLVRSVLERVSDLKASDYSEPIIQCITDLLQNKKLLCFFSQTLLHSTDSLNPNEVDISLNLLDEWFLVVAPDMADPLPGNMCFETLFDALSILLQSNHYQVLLKALTFMYMHSGRVYGKVRTKLCSLFLEKHFRSLFLHWHPEVRLMFHRILIYRLNRLGIKSESTDKGSDKKGPSRSFEHHLRNSVQKVLDFDTTGNSFNAGGGEGGKSKMSIGETMRMQKKIVEDPDLKNCACVFTPLNNSQLEVDIKLHDLLYSRLKELQGPKRMNVQGNPVRILTNEMDLQMYLPTAMFEFKNCARSYVRLQESVSDLQPYEVITPEYHFDISITL
eukprot:CAMPEP_0184493460 /NCGR_PEP_ID=MMETSP0113_2-20130426/26059_1 /TAXON_ID=91329 /ORGANISM="Norrisiella sphaerica, Strain BC52" /LENGTH=621 /DNA_ID=CAMNT_0026878719 /DNA_START=147 /DNA_END=2012 /DNA_ORIENTATION=-